MKRALVFHDKGIAGAEGQITDWIIHEYRLQDYTTTSTLPMGDGLVLCKLYMKLTVKRKRNETPNISKTNLWQ
ncbi:hypothetical protein P8452_06287 [Trifolium repens]|nr:hypothetical protein P8452_06287 [Trifolium repens]